MKPYQPISGFMAHVYMFHAHPAAPLDCNTRQASGLLTVFFLSLFDRWLLTILGIRAEKYPHPHITLARPHLDLSHKPQPGLTSKVGISPCSRAHGLARTRPEFYPICPVTLQMGTDNLNGESAGQGMVRADRVQPALA